MDNYLGQTQICLTVSLFKVITTSFLFSTIKATGSATTVVLPFLDVILIIL